MQATSGPQRDKTRPAARLGGPPGTKLSQQAPKRRFRPTFRMQGELYPACRAASGTKLSQQAALTGPPGTKLSQQAALAGPPGTKLSQHARLDGPPGTKLSQQAPKRQFRPTFRMQGELFTASATNNPSRENFVPLPPPTTRAGRTLSRMRCHFRYKTLPASPARRPTRYKTLPASPKTPISAHFSHAGRTLYRFRHQHDEQGEQFRAPTPHRTPTTCPSPNFACNSIE